MVRRIFAIVLIVLGLGTAGAAVASGTVWRPDDRVTLTLPADPDVPLVITAPGVLNAVDNEVEVTLVGATAETPLMLAMADETDVRAWVGDAPHLEITGLADWETLTVTDSRDQTPEPTASDSASASESASADPSASPSESASPEEPASPEDSASAEDPSESATEAEEQTVPNPSGSDLWVEEVTGTGELTYTWTAVPGRWMLLAASDGTEPAPQVELTWSREVTTPFVLPGIILGGLLFLVGLGLLILQLLVDREHRRARRAAATAPAEARSDDVPVAVGAAATTGETAAVATPTAEDGRPLTRREIRLAEAQRRSGRAPKSASTPVDGETELISAVDPDATGVISTAGGAAATDTTAAAPSHSADTPARGIPTGAAGPAEEPGELDAWVRSGAASPLLHESDRTTPTDLSHTDVEGSAADDGSTGDAAPARESWWRRRRDRDRPAPAAATPEAAEPAPPDSTEQIPVVQEEDTPEVSGASWRETWGLGGQPGSDPTRPSDSEGQR